MNTIARLFFLLALLLFWPHADLRAEEAGEIEHFVSVTMTPERSHIEPGETIFIAITQDIAPGWHTYWHNPGDSGQAMHVSWTALNGFEAGTLHWPVPVKLPIKGLMNYGHYGTVTMLQEITAPNPLPDGPVTLEAETGILVCKDVCIPEYSSHKITFNNGANETHRALIAETVEKLPLPFDGTAYFREDGDNLVLNVHFEKEHRLLVESFNKRTDFDLFPYQWGLVDAIEPTHKGLTEEELMVRQKKGDESLTGRDEIKTLIAFTTVYNERSAIIVSAKPDPDWLAGKTENATGNDTQNTPTATDETAEKFPFSGFTRALFFAFLGGLILNLMPCVFPVLSMKALSLCKLSAKENHTARLHGLEYAAGVILSFLTIAGILIALKAAGSQIGWGFHLQNPFMILALSYLFFVLGLNLSGFFEIRGVFTSLGNDLTRPDRMGGSFFAGVLAVVVAAPCTAPFMGAAMGFAFSQPAPITLSVFVALGAGLAFPYVLLSFIPSLRSKLPKPGAWMVTFKEFLAFPMFASAIWLVWVLGQQTGAAGPLQALSGMLLIAFALWLTKKAPDQGPLKVTSSVIAVCAILAAFLYSCPACEQHQPGQPVTYEQTEKGSTQEPYTSARLEELLSLDAPVFVNMTAAWCITCKANEKAALSREETKTIFNEMGVHYLKGDWTNRDPAITAYLSSFNRQGVPLYIYYGPRDEKTGNRPDPVVLPQILTPAIVKKALHVKEN